MLPSSLTNVLSSSTKHVSPQQGETVHHLEEGNSQELLGCVEVCVEQKGTTQIHLAPFGTTLTGPLTYTYLRRTPEHIYSAAVETTPLSKLKSIFIIGSLLPSLVVFLHFMVLPILGNSFNGFYAGGLSLLMLILAYFLPTKLLEMTAEKRLQTCIVQDEDTPPELKLQSDLTPELQTQFEAVLTRIEEALNGPLPSAKAATLRHARTSLNALMSKLQNNAQLQNSPQAISHVQSFLTQTQDRMVPLLEHHQTIAFDDLTAEMSALNTQLERL